MDAEVVLTPKRAFIPQAKSKEKKTRRNRYKQPQEDTKVSESQKSLLNFLCPRFPQLSSQIVLQVIRSVGSNVQEIQNSLLELSGNIPDRPVSVPKGRSNNIELQCQQFMNQLIDEVEFDPFELQELFEDMSLMVKNSTAMNSQEKDMFSQYSGNMRQFMQLKVGYLDELNIEGVDEKYMSQRLPLLKEIDTFSREQALKIGQELVNKVVQISQEAFPSPTPSKQESIITKLNNKTVQEGIESNMYFRKSEFFNSGNKRLPNYNQNNSHHEIHGKNKHDTEDVKTLCKQYQLMPHLDLKIIYSIIGNLSGCRRFLQTYYGKQKSYLRNVQKQRNAQKEQKHSMEALSREQKTKSRVNRGFENQTLEELRSFVNHQMKLKVVVNKAYHSINNSNSKKKLMDLVNANNNTLKEYLIASRSKKLERVFESDHPNRLDLHGFFAVEIESMVQEYIQEIPTEHKRGNRKLVTRHIEGKLVCDVQIITGKGNNSQNRISVIKPIVYPLLELMGFRPTQKEGSFIVRIPLV